MEKKRITRNQLNIQIALLVSQRATCCRLSVGAIAVKDNRIIHTAYNGPAKGEPHCNPELCNPENPCLRSIHAEDNLITSAKELGINLQGADLFITDQPCLNCSRKILRAGFERVYYLRDYRLQDGINNLLTNDVKVFQIDEQGKSTRRQ